MSRRAHDSALLLANPLLLLLSAPLLGFVAKLSWLSPAGLALLVVDWVLMRSLALAAVLYLELPAWLDLLELVVVIRIEQPVLMCFLGPEDELEASGFCLDCS